MQSLSASAVEDPISFLTPTGELPLLPRHSSFIERPVQLWLAHIPSPLQIFPLIFPTFPFFLRTTA